MEIENKKITTTEKTVKYDHIEIESAESEDESTLSANQQEKYLKEIQDKNFNDFIQHFVEDESFDSEVNEDNYNDWKKAQHEKDVFPSDLCDKCNKKLNDKAIIVFINKGVDYLKLCRECHIIFKETIYTHYCNPSDDSDEDMDEDDEESSNEEFSGRDNFSNMSQNDSEKIHNPGSWENDSYKQRNMPQEEQSESDERYNSWEIEPNRLTMFK